MFGSNQQILFLVKYSKAKVVLVTMLTAKSLSTSFQI